MKNNKVLILLSLILLNGCTAITEFYEKVQAQAREKRNNELNLDIEKRHKYYESEYANCKYIKENKNNLNTLEKIESIKSSIEYLSKGKLNEYNYLDEQKLLYYNQGKPVYKNKYKESDKAYLKQKDIWFKYFESCSNLIKEDIDFQSIQNNLVKNVFKSSSKTYSSKKYQQYLDETLDITKFYHGSNKKDMNVKYCELLEQRALAKNSLRQKIIKDINSKKTSVKNRDELNKLLEETKDKYTPDWDSAGECYSYFLKSNDVTRVKNLCLKYKDCMSRVDFIKEMRKVKAASDFVNGNF
jgi:hypothetical protein